MGIDSFIVYIQTEQIAKEVEARLQIMNKKDPCLEGKIKKVIELLKDKLGGKIMTEFAILRPKLYWYLTDNNDKNKTSKGTKKCVIKQKLNFEDFKNV